MAIHGAATRSDGVADLPNVRRRPSDYVREHVRFTTQPIEEVDVSTLRDYIQMMDLGDNLMFSTDYPHWSHDSPTWAIKRFPKDQRDRIMRGNAMALYGLPHTVKGLPGELGGTRAPQTVLHGIVSV